ncbi:MAG TPA: hypothetical protein VJH89_01010 [Patescibacteria group bacterium]|nr:hypothetical protein [Patescibacteria group bacterium]
MTNKFEQNAKIIPPSGDDSKPDQDTIPNERQQNKIVAVFERKNFDLISRDAIEDVSEYEREYFLQKMAKRTITTQELSSFLARVGITPQTYEKHKDTFTKICAPLLENKRIRTLVAELVRKDTQKYEDIVIQDMMCLLQWYPDPLTLENEAQEFLDEIENNNSPQKRQQYVDALTQLMRGLYGKRQEYYEQIKLLRAEGEKKYGSSNASHNGEKPLQRSSVPDNNPEKTFTGYTPFKKPSNDDDLTGEHLTRNGVDDDDII